MIQTTISKMNTRKGTIEVVRISHENENPSYKVMACTSLLVETTSDLTEALAVARGMWKAIELWS